MRAQECRPCICGMLQRTPTCLVCSCFLGACGSDPPGSAGIPKETDCLCGVQPRFRSMWERYCRGVQAIVYVVDAADHDNLDSARLELAELLGKPSLHSIPLLVLGNKNDLPGALSTTDLIDRLDLKASLPTGKPAIPHIACLAC